MHRRRFVGSFAALPLLGMSACAGLPGAEAPRVTIVGLEPLSGEGLELRFMVKLRIQNPNSTEFNYDGAVVDLEVNGRGLASGVTDAAGSVPRFGTALLSIPVSVHAVGVVRQLIALATGPSAQTELPYVARGRLGGGWPGGTRFSAEGVLKFPQ
jgi:Late embryogenesis abundant protein